MAFDIENEILIPTCMGCNKEQNTNSLFPENVSLAMAYVPFQEWRGIYDVENAFNRGTLFADLDKPFLGYGRGRQ